MQADPHALFGRPLDTGRIAATPQVEGVPFADRVADGFEAARRLDAIGGDAVLIQEEFVGRLKAIEATTGQKLPNPYRDRFDDVDEAAIYRQYRDTGRGATAAAERRILHLKRQSFERRVDALVATHPDIETADRFQARVEARAEELRIQQTLAGPIAGLVGGFGAAFTDPLNLGTLPFGGGGRSLLGVALREAGLNAVIEGTSQPLVAAQRERLGQELSRDEALLNIGAAALFGGVLGGGGKALELLLSRPDRELAEMIDALPEEQRTEVMEEVAAALEADAAARSAFGDADDLEGLEDDILWGGGRREQGDIMIEAEQALEQGAPLPDARGAVGPAEPDGFLPSGGGLDAPPQQWQPGQDLPVSKRQDFDPASLVVDARRFQFKSDGDAEGVNDTLRFVKKWDVLKSGDIIVWEARDGTRYVADGHQRTGLARRLNAEGQSVQVSGFVLREVDGITAELARGLAAAKNIAQGTGSTIDAAKVLRADPDLMDGSLNPRTAKFRNARDLMALNDEAFLMVVNELVDPAQGAIVARLARDPGEQVAILSLLHDAAPGTLVEAEALVRSAQAAGFVKEVTEDLFGTADVTTSLIKERSAILSQAISRLRRDRALFRKLVENRADIEAAGNTLDAQKNKELADNAAEIADIVLRTSSTVGPVSEALKRAVASRSGGASVRAAAGQFIDDLVELGPRQLRGIDGAGGSSVRGGNDSDAAPPSRPVAAAAADLAEARRSEPFDNPQASAAEQRGLMEADVAGAPEPARPPADGEVAAAPPRPGDDEMLLVGTELDEDGNEVPIMMTRRELREEIEQENGMFERLEGCVRPKGTP